MTFPLPALRGPSTREGRRRGGGDDSKPQRHGACFLRRAPTPRPGAAAQVTPKSRTRVATCREHTPTHVRPLGHRSTERRPESVSRGGCGSRFKRQQGEGGAEGTEGTRSLTETGLKGQNVLTDVEARHVSGDRGRAIGQMRLIRGSVLTSAVKRAPVRAVTPSACRQGLAKRDPRWHAEDRHGEGRGAPPGSAHSGVPHETPAPPQLVRVCSRPLTPLLGSSGARGVGESGDGMHLGTVSPRPGASLSASLRHRSCSSQGGRDGGRAHAARAHTREC